MSPTAIGDLIIVEIYYVLAALMLFVAFVAHTRGGILRLTHPLVWCSAATFFIGCGSDHVLMVLADEVGHSDSHTRLSHSVFVVMQVFGGLAFVFAVVPFVRKLLKLDTPSQASHKLDDAAGIAAQEVKDTASQTASNLERDADSG